MTVLLDTSFPGADVNPLPSAGAPFAKLTGVADFQRISNTAAVASASTFAAYFDDSQTYPVDHYSEVTIGTLGGGDFGPAVRCAGGSCYFIQCANGVDIALYKYVSGGFNLIQNISGQNYGTAGNRIRLEATGTSTTSLKVFRNDVQVNTTYNDSSTPLTTGKPGMSGYDGTFRISRLTAGDFVSGPTIASTSSATPRRGSAQTVGGTGFGATQGTKQLRLGGVVQTTTSWADTSIGYVLAADLIKSGISVNAEIWETSPSDSLLSNSFALTSIQPSLGWSFIDVGTPNIVADNRLTFSADAVSGDQAEWETTDGASEFTVDTDLTYVATGYGVFAARLWTTGDGYGASADQTVNPPLPVLSAPGVSTLGSTTARPQVTITF